MNKVLMNKSSLAFLVTALLSTAACTDGGDAAMLSLEVPGAVRVNQGRTVTVPVAIIREGGDTDVAVEVTGLPAGVTADPVTIAAGSTEGTLVLSASVGAMINPDIPVTITASAGATTDAQPLQLSVVGVRGELDSTFGNAGSGVVIHDVPGVSTFAQGCALAADGKTIVAVGTSAPGIRVQRYLASGQPDPTFDGDGDAAVASGASVSLGLGTSVVVRGDGTVLVAYRDGTSARVQGFTAQGAPLPGFGQASSTLTLDPNAQHISLLVDGAGAVFVFVGLLQSTKVYKLTAGGAFDPGFGNAGSVTIDGIRVHDAEYTAQGKILVAGQAGLYRAIARLTAGGALDNTFGTMGKTVLSDTQAESYDVEPLPDGRSVATAAWSPGEVLVFNGTGALDGSFSGDGRLEIAPVYLWATAFDGSLFVTGARQTSFEVYRLSTADGSLVTDFGAGGVAKANVSLVDAAMFATCLDSAGRLTMAGGSSRSPNDYSVALARMWL